jgi:hypothetical protein
MKSIPVKYRLFLYLSIGIGFLIGFYIITIVAIIISGDRYTGMTTSALISPVLVSLVASMVISRILVHQIFIWILITFILTGLIVGLGFLLYSMNLIESEKDYGIKGLAAIVTISNFIILEGFYWIHKLFKK